MANEIRVTTEMNVRKNGFLINPGTRNKAITMAGDDGIQKTQLVGFAAAELVDLGEITGAPEYIQLQNQDATNFVLVGFTNPPTEMKLKPGYTLLIPPTTANIYVKADTAACRITVEAVEA